MTSHEPAAVRPERVTAPALIPRALLFGNPERAQARLSPEGERLSWLAPSEAGVLNVWVRPVEGGEARMATRDEGRGIREHLWAHDGRHLLYVQDVGGDENWHLYSVDLETEIVRDLTPFQGVRAQNVLLDRHHPHELLVGLNLRDRRVFDMHRVDLGTGAVTLDTENPGDVLAWATDAAFRIRAALAADPREGSSALRVREAPGAEWREIARWPFGEHGGPVDFSADGRSLLVESSLGSDTTRLVRLDAATGAELEEIARHELVDLEQVVVDPESRAVQAVSFDYLGREWHPLDESVRADFEALARASEGELSIVARDRRDRRWIATFERDRGPLAYVLWDRERREATPLFTDRPALEGAPFVPRTAVLIAARDGRELVSYLTRPAGSEGRPGPLVLLVHGGPWHRDRAGFDAEAQWLANRGYAVLQVNFRGSTGFGKALLNAGNGEWGVGAMQHDLSDAVRWAVGAGIADPARVAIFGGSYGGYAVLAGLAFTPELYCCGVDIVGPSNVRTLLESIPPYWEPVKREFLLRVGDVVGDEELNRRISPLFHVERIRAPLLIAQGRNDPRVNVRESDQIVAAMRDRGLPVRYVLYPDEGHGFAQPENRLDFYARAEEFLAEHLGGRAEPATPVPGTTAEER